MSQNEPVKVVEWQDFLRGYSDDYLRGAIDQELAYLDAVQRESRWLGYEPADEDAVANFDASSFPPALLHRQSERWAFANTPGRRRNSRI